MDSKNTKIFIKLLKLNSTFFILSKNISVLILFLHQAFNTGMLSLANVLYDMEPHFDI